MKNSEQLIQLIQQNIIANNGCIPFSQYMDLVLYTPNLGYYNQNGITIGKDFTTAPEISPLFGATLAQAINFDSILEIGAGNGTLCVQIMKALDSTIKNYFILERSSFLISLQKQCLIDCGIDISKITWLDCLPQNFNGSIIANEVLDALAVDVWAYDFKQKIWQPRNVIWNDILQVFEWENSKSHSNISKELPSQIEYLEYFGADYYVTESHNSHIYFLNSLCNCLNIGEIILIDYGFLAHEYYHPNRYMGTLMCYYQHKAHYNPFVNICQQDISSHVNFSLVHDILEQNKFNIDYFANQANFLLDYGILALLNKHIEKDNYLQYSNQVQKLISEAEMGSLFKVLIANKLKS